MPDSFKLKTDSLNSLIEVYIMKPSYIVSASNKSAKALLLEQVPAEDRPALKRVLSSNSRFLPSVDSPIGQARSVVNAFLKDMVAGDNKRGYRGFAKVGRPNTYIGRLQDFDRFEELLNAAKSQVEKYNLKIRESWDELKARGKEEMMVFNGGVEFPTVDRFLRKSTLDFEVSTNLSEAKIFDTAIAEVVRRVKAKAEKSERDRVLSAHAKPVEQLLDALGECIQRLHQSNGKTESGKSRRLRADKFNTVAKIVEEVRGKNFLNLPELETAAATAASLVDGLDVVGLDPAERKDKAEEFSKVTDSLKSRLAASGLV